MNYRTATKSEILLRILMIAFGIFFFFLLGDRSYAMYKDSAAFIEWSYSGPVQAYYIYPGFLGFFRLIFGEDLYLQAVNIFQSLFAFITSFLFAEYLKKTYSLGCISAFVSYIAICCVYGYSLPEVVASHYIDTESLTFPIFHVMLIFILRYLNEEKTKHLVFSFALCMISVFIRPQMIFFVIIQILVPLIKAFAGSAICEKKAVAYSIPFALIILWIAGIWIVTCLTVTVFKVSLNSQYHEAVAGKVMCVMKEEDSALYDDMLREGYETLYDKTRDNGGLSSDLPKSLLDYEKVQRTIDVNMRSCIYTVWDWYNDRYEPIDRTGISVYRNKIIETELDAHKAEYAGIILRLMPSSFVSSIFIQPVKIRLICNLIALALYIAAIAAMYLAYDRGVGKKWIEPMAVSLLAIVVNATLCNVVLYGQQRYVVYCFGLFYASFIILIKGIRDKATATK